MTLAEALKNFIRDLFPSLFIDTKYIPEKIIRTEPIPGQMRMVAGIGKCYVTQVSTSIFLKDSYKPGDYVFYYPISNVDKKTNTVKTEVIELSVFINNSEVVNSDEYEKFLEFKKWKAEQSKQNTTISKEYCPTKEEIQLIKKTQLEIDACIKK